MFSEASRSYGNSHSTFKKECAADISAAISCICPSEHSVALLTSNGLFHQRKNYTGRVQLAFSAVFVIRSETNKLCAILVGTC